MLSSQKPLSVLFALPAGTQITIPDLARVSKTRYCTRPEIAQNETMVHLWCGSKEPYAIKSHNILKRYLKNYKEEIMPGFGHGEFLMKHQKEVCKKIHKTFS